MVLAGPVAVAAATTTTSTTTPSPTTSSPTTPSPTTPSAGLAQRVLAASLEAASRQRSVHYVAHSSLGPESLELVSDVSKTASQQTITISTGKHRGHLTARWVNNSVYFKGDQTGLEGYLGMPTTLAPKYTGRWIVFKSTDQGYAAIARSMQLDSVVSEVTISPPFTKISGLTIGGTHTTGVRGKTTAFSSPGSSGTATLYVEASSGHLPVRFIAVGSQPASSLGQSGAAASAGHSSTPIPERGTLDFSEWGEPVHLSQPTNAVPASKVG